MTDNTSTPAGPPVPPELPQIKAPVIDSEYLRKKSYDEEAGGQIELATLTMLRALFLQNKELAYEKEEMDTFRFQQSEQNRLYGRG